MLLINALRRGAFRIVVIFPVMILGALNPSMSHENFVERASSCKPIWDVEGSSGYCPEQPFIQSAANGSFEPALTDAALGTNVGYVRLVNIGKSKTKEDMVAKRTEYLIIQYASDSSIIKQLRAPKSVNPRLLLERLVCQDLDDDAVISSCLRSNDKRFYDPFQLIDMREEHGREQARDALTTNPETKDPIGIHNRARNAQIPHGKTLLIAGVNHDYFVKEVEV